MKIAIDITRAIIETAGIGRYTREITKNILKIDSGDQFTLLSTHFNSDEEKISRLREFISPNSRIKRLKIPGNFKELSWGWSWNWYEQSLANSEVLFAPSFFEVNLGFRLPQVVTIHDMATFLFPEQRGEEVSKRHNERVKKVCAKARKIIAISESTKKDIIKFLNVSPEKIEIIYPGNTEFPEQGKLPESLKPKSYILFVGTIEPRKNLKNLLKAYDLLSTDLKKEYELVIVGGKGWNTDEELKEIGQKEGVRWLGFVSDADLGELYRQAKVFAYPSLYEGFGLPVIEAQQFGVPVVTSNISSLPEAVGEGGLKIDPHDPQMIANSLMRILEDKLLYASLSRSARENVLKFSWEKAAKETAEVLKSVVK